MPQNHKGRGYLYFKVWKLQKVNLIFANYFGPFFKKNFPSNIGNFNLCKNGAEILSEVIINSIKLINQEYVEKMIR